MTKCAVCDKEINREIPYYELGKTMVYLLCEKCGEKMKSQVSYKVLKLIKPKRKIVL